MIDTRNVSLNNEATNWLRDYNNTICRYDVNSWLTSEITNFNYEPKKPYKQFTLAFPEIDKVIFHAPATVIIFEDGTKSVVKCSEHDEYDPEKGFAMALLKHVLGKEKYKKVFKKYVK